MRPPASTHCSCVDIDGRRFLAARSASRVRWRKNSGCPVTRSAPARSLTIAAKALSNSERSRISRSWSSSPMDLAAALTAFIICACAGEPPGLDQPGWLDALRTGARIMFAAGARRVFFNSHRPLILNRSGDIDATLTADLVRSERIQITSGHPMGGCALGGTPKRDVGDSRGRSWDVDGLYVADSSILPTSMGVNPCYTVYALGRYIAQGIVEDVRASSPSSLS